MPHPYRKLALLIAALCVSTTSLSTQTRPLLQPADYGKFETLGFAPRGGLSPDGKWLAYAVTRSNRNNELRVKNLANGSEKVVAFGASPAFSDDSKWIAYSIGMSEVDQEKLRRDRKPVQNKLGILNLSTGEMTTIDGVESFSFDGTGGWMAMRRYAPERAANAPAPGPDDPPAGTTLVVRTLASGLDASFGNINEYAWQPKGRLLAMAVSAADKVGNGLQLLDPSTGTLRVLDSGASIYSMLSWRNPGADGPRQAHLAALKSKTDDKREGPTHVLLAWKNAGAPDEQKHVFDPTVQSFPGDQRIVSFRRPSWSHDGRIVFAGVADWQAKPEKKKDEKPAPAPTPDDQVDVDIWHPRDAEVMPLQKTSATAARRRNMLGAWHLHLNEFVKLGNAHTETVTPLRHRPYALVQTWTPYAMQRSIGRGAFDLSLVDLATGQRTQLRDRVSDDFVQASPGGRYVLFLENDQFWTIDTTTRKAANITAGVKTTFVDKESDDTTSQKPPFGIGGWTKNDEHVLLYDKFDIWRIAANGSGAVTLTDGTKESVRHRLHRLDPDEEFVALDRPRYLSLRNIWTKQSGYGVLNAGAEGPRRLTRAVWMNKLVYELAKAEKADVFTYVAQAYDDAPDVFVSGPDLANAQQVTALNPFQSEYAWGRSELVEYRNRKGARLQGILTYPAAYDPSKKYPMVVYMYERLSDGLHRYVPPDERSPYNVTAFIQRGYFVLQPDIVFEPRQPGLSVADCVGAAVAKVTSMNIIDPSKVGITGHSWGGFDTVFLATNTKLFAAAVAGAPITNLVSNYGNHHWGSGIAETDHIETGQQRMEVPIYEDPEAYLRNSSTSYVHTMTTPLLVVFGESDGTVHFHQGVELYNIARRAGKQVVMLVYPGEDHGLRRRPNQLDYHRRIQAWFGHYLKGEPAEKWITEGRTFLAKEAEKGR